MASTSVEATSELGSTHDTVIPLLQDPIPFNPLPTTSNDRFPNFRSNSVPRHLFRVFTPKSWGETTDAYVRPRSTAELSPESQRLDIFASYYPDIRKRFQHRLTDPPDTAELLRTHLNFRCGPDCNFVSWSSSLLFALQYALYRMEYLDHLRASRGQVKILLLDTTKLPRSTFISEIELLNYFAPYENYQGDKSLRWLRDLRLKRAHDGYYFGEYLSQGDLKIAGACVQTDLQALIDHGLFGLLPELGEEWRWKFLILNGGVLSLRQALKLNLVHRDRDCTMPTETATRDEVFRAIEVAKLFSSDELDFTVPAAAMLLALRQRNKKDPVILNVFKETFSAAKIESLSLGETKVPTELWLPEVSQFRMIIEDLQRHFEPSEGEPLEELPGEDAFEEISALIAGLDISSM
ncbi:hypothetical protein B0T21DRAFT_413868 [Apiosordaria backusii]|uniref:DUF7587 domain-containing protein n=1 Tax=Apiosordaria backusii TaxID=314023 RepID=A0AA40E8Q2_9PEZI|nr:hypothetical protein B0T21DRAFT_413868 [Apiosordaria backusii]